MDGKPKAKKDDDPLDESMLDLSKVKEKQRQPPRKTSHAVYRTPMQAGGFRRGMICNKSTTLFCQSDGAYRVIVERRSEICYNKFIKQ